MNKSRHTIQYSVILTCASLAVAACYYNPPRGRDSGFDDSGDEDTQATPADEYVPVLINQDVDILFVIDNTGSMSDPQSILARDSSTFINALEDLSANYRIGFTTTDTGSPRCPNTTPENGKLQLNSCLDRIEAGEFVTANGDFSQACSSYCTKRDADLEILPTTTQLDPKPAPRMWIEKSGKNSNIEGVSSNTEAFRCYAPQGVTGCGFESHLDSMYRSLSQSSQKGSNHGFLREAAVLAIIIVSDEIDCSYQKEDVFITNKVFWYSPDDPAPTSALCWNAGVHCTGDGNPYSSCRAANWGLNANEDAAVLDVSGADAILHPVEEYITFIDAIETAKQGIDQDQRVIVSMINGVPAGYEDKAENLVYSKPSDEDYYRNFGIGPGCTLGDPANGGRAAVPPVREHEFAESFDDSDDGHALYSICEDSYADTLASIAGKIGEQLRPGCMPSCVLDLDLSTTIADADCRLFESVDGINLLEIEPCVSTTGDWAPQNEGTSICFAQLVDPDGAQTPGVLDDMSTFCADRGHNLEFKVVRTSPTPLGSRITALCQLSDNKPRDCPML